MVWSKDEDILSPTTTWQNLDLLQYDVKPMKNEELFGEGNAIRDIVKIIRKLVPISAKKSHSVNDWRTIFVQSFKKGSPIYDSTDGDVLRKMAIRMAVSDPTTLFENGWKTNSAPATTQ